MKKLLALLSSALLLSACASGGGVATKRADIDPLSSVRAACAVVPAAHDTFLALDRDPDHIAIEAQVKAGLDAICDHPEDVTDVPGAIRIVSDGVSRIVRLRAHADDDPRIEASGTRR